MCVTVYNVCVRNSCLCCLEEGKFQKYSDEYCFLFSKEMDVSYVTIDVRYKVKNIPVKRTFFITSMRFIV